MKKKLTILTILLITLTTTACQNSTMNKLEGTWIADPKNQSVIITGDTSIGGKEEYQLTFNSDETFTLELASDNTIEGTYTVDENDNIELKDDNDITIETCTLSGDSQLQCDGYASIYEKQDK